MVGNRFNSIQKSEGFSVSHIMSAKSDELKSKRYRSSKRHHIFSNLHLDLPLLILLLLLMLIGMWTLYSASGGSNAITQKQLVRYFIGVFGMLVMAQVRATHLQQWSGILYAVSIVLLALVLFTDASKGSSRWLNLYVFSIQPAELIKFTLPIFIATITSRYVLPLRFKTITLSLVAIALPAALIYLQPDLGTMIIVLASGLAILFFAGLAWWLIIGSIIMVVAAIPFVWQLVLHDYQKKRVLTFLNPEQDSFGSGWNILQSQTAIGSGGITGKGWLQGTQAQLDFLPESHTDFIFAVLAEETGMIGVLILLIIYAFIILRCCHIAANSHTLFERLLVSAITFIFFLYTFINIGMTSGLLPVVGVPLPLISYGGSSVVSLLTSFGVIMSIHARHNRQVTSAG